MLRGQDLELGDRRSVERGEPGRGGVLPRVASREEVWRDVGPISEGATVAPKPIGDTLLLDSPRAKFQHARSHRDRIIEFANEWSATREPQPMPIEKRTEPYQDGGELVRYFVGRSIVSVPVEIPLMLGDALFNYRAALDHLAWLLVTHVGVPKRPESVYFPIVLVRSRFKDDFAAKMPGVSDVTESIVERHQPYRWSPRAGTHPLAVLNSWNRTDKHRTLPVVEISGTKLTLTLPGSYENFDVWKQERHQDVEYLLPGTELIRIYGKRRDPRRDHGVKVFVQGEATISHESGKPIEMALRQIDAAVEAILIEFEGQP